MMRIAMSHAANGLFRALADRASVPRNRILLSEWKSVDWRSLTMEGERHNIRLRLSGPDSAAVAARLTNGLADADFTIPGQIVAEIVAACEPLHCADGSTEVVIEALTIAE